MMSNLEQNRMNLNDAGLEMFNLCDHQLRSTRDAFYNLDHELAEEVIHLEKRINALDIRIDRECERFLALHQPVAHDLRFVLGLRKINFGLERIGDNCFSMSKHITETKELPKEEVLLKFRLDEMFKNTLSMMKDISEAYKLGGSKDLRKIFAKQQVLEDVYNKSFHVVSTEVKKDASLIDQYLLLFTLIKKLETTGNLITNIAEEIIFYCEAEIWRHQQEKFEWD